VDHTGQKAGYIEEGLAGKLQGVRIVVDTAEDRYKEVHYCRKEYDEVRMVGKGLVDSQSVGHRAH
jgi:hypothetical protein